MFWGVWIYILYPVMAVPPSSGGSQPKLILRNVTDSMCGGKGVWGGVGEVGVEKEGRE
jgi:hypothetical protein